MKRSLFILMSVVVLDLIGFGIVVPILPFYAVQYGASVKLLGWLLTSYSAMQFLFAPLWGRLSDRVGRKKILIMTSAGTALSLLILGFASSLPVLFIGRILGGIFAANVGVASAYVADVTTEENRAQGMGLIGASFGIGFILGPAIGGLLSPFGYSVPILVGAVLSVANMIYAALSLPEPSHHHAIEPNRSFRLLSHRPVLIFCLLQLAFTLGVNQLESIFAFFMMDRFSYDALHVSFILVGMAVVLVVIQGGLIQRLTDLLGEKRLLLVGLVFLSISFFFLPRMGTVAVLMIPLLLSAVGRGISQPSLMSLVSKKAEPHQRGAIMGSFQSAASLARVLGPLMAGYLYDQSAPFPFLFASGLMLLTFMGALTIIPK